MGCQGYGPPPPSRLHFRPLPFVEGTQPMPLLQLTYASRPFGYDMAVLRGILMDDCRCNARDGVTGR